MDTISNWFVNVFLASILEWAENHILNVIVIIVVGYILYRFGAKLAAKIVRSLVKTTKKRSWPKKDIEKRQNTLAALASTTWKLVVSIIIVVTLTEEMFPSSSFSAVIASLGVIGVAVGLGAQSLVKDFISGLFIISENQYRVGDIIDINGAVGRVERISTRTTTMRDEDGNVHYFPNGTITHVVNKTMEYSHSHFEVKISIDNDIDKVISIINTIGEEVADDPKWARKILEPQKVERISGFDGKVITISILGKTLPSDQWQVSSDMRQRLISEFKRKKITMP